MSNLGRLVSNLKKITLQPIKYLRIAATITRDDVCKERIDGQQTVGGQSLAGKNSYATMLAKKKKGRSPYTHSLWDTQTMREPSEWEIHNDRATQCSLRPSANIAYRAINVQALGYDFFGISDQAREKYDKAIRDQLDKDLNEGITNG